MSDLISFIHFSNSPFTLLVCLAIPLIIYALGGGSSWKRWVIHLGLGWSSLFLFSYVGMTFGVSEQVASGIAGFSSFIILKAVICYSQHQAFLCHHAENNRRAKQHRENLSLKS